MLVLAIGDQLVTFAIAGLAILVAQASQAAPPRGGASPIIGFVEPPSIVHSICKARAPDGKRKGREQSEGGGIIRRA